MKSCSIFWWLFVIAYITPIVEGFAPWWVMTGLTLAGVCLLIKFPFQVAADLKLMPKE